MAAVTVYKPNETVLRRLVERLRDDGIPLLVHVDGPVGEAIDHRLLEAFTADRALTILQAPTNCGIGAALNRLAVEARRKGFRRIFFLDQDSDAPAGIVHRLSATFDRLEATGFNVAAVGPKPTAPEGEAIKAPHYHRRMLRAQGARPFVAVDYVITSGSLVSLRAWASVGPFREDYFIDAIDTEWCFRAWRQGHGVFFEPAIALPHRIGQGVLRFGPIAFPVQSETRMLSYVRNQTHMLRLGHVPVRWKLRSACYLPLQIALYLLRGRSRAGSGARLAKAAWAGLRGNLGRPVLD